MNNDASRSHPYFDTVSSIVVLYLTLVFEEFLQKTDKEKPKWYMVDVKFQRRVTHFVSLSLLKRIASGETDDVAYLDVDDVASIKGTASCWNHEYVLTSYARYGFDQPRSAECTKGRRGRLGSCREVSEQRWVGGWR